MNQLRDFSPLPIQLIPMELSDTVPQAVGKNVARSPLAGLGTETDESSDSQILVYPGEPTEILLKLENPSNRRLRLNVQIEADFPSQWYRLGMEGYELPPKSQIEAVLYFQIPGDYFESREALGVAESLRLDYRGRIYVYYDELETNRQLSEIADFKLYVRPRSLYLNFVPEFYREVDFIGRLLKIFEQGFEPSVQKFDVLWAYLNPLTAPETLLPFVAYWVGWKMNPALPLERQRLLISKAIDIYRWRGTRKGLRLYLSTVLDLPLDEELPEVQKRISIQEVFGRGFIINEARIGEGAIVGGGKPYHFIVILRPERSHQIDENLVRQIIDQEKPAFCTYELFFEPVN